MNAAEFDALVFVNGADPEYRIIKAARMILVENRDMNFALLAISLNPNDSLWRDRVQTEVARYECFDLRIRDAYHLNTSDQAIEESEEKKATVEEIIPVQIPEPEPTPLPQLKDLNKMTGEERAEARIALRNAETEKKRLKREADLQKSRYAKY